MEAKYTKGLEFNSHLLSKIRNSTAPIVDNAKYPNSKNVPEIFSQTGLKRRNQYPVI